MTTVYNTLDAPTVKPADDEDIQQLPTDRALPAVGSIVGDYELVSEVARGGMGIVFLARQRKLNRMVALKMILDSDAASLDAVDRFFKEAEAAAALDHPGIVPVYEVGDDHGRPYFSMAYVEGEDLSSQLKHGPLPPRRCAQIAMDVARAIAYAHSQKVIHRDLKPANILIDQTGAIRITDFGVCKFLNSGTTVTKSDGMIGTPHYMPPEQAGSKKHTPGPASDVYSIGAVLYALLTGRPPFEAADPIDVVSQVLTQQPLSPRKLNSAIPPELDIITLKCLAKSPRHRYASADDLADDLQRFLNGEPIVARPPTPLQKAVLFLRQQVFLASVSGAAAFLLVALTAVVTIAFARTRIQLTEAQNLLVNERESARMFAKLLVDQKSNQTRPSMVEFDVARLTDSALRLENTDQNDESLQLAIAAVELAHEHKLEAPSNSMRILKRALNMATAEQNEDPEDGDNQTESRSIEEILDAAREQVKKPFSEFELNMYGIKISSPDDSNSK